MQTQTDLDLVKKVQSGSLQAFKQLIENHKNHVFHLCLKILKNQEESEEVAQDVFIKIYKALKKFRGDSKFSTWLYRITYNECLVRLRKNRKRLLQTELDEEVLDLEFIEQKFQQVEIDERNRIIDRSLNVLDEINRTIILLYYYHENSVEEISKIVGLSETNIKTRLFRARKQLLSYFEKKLKIANKEMI